MALAIKQIHLVVRMRRHVKRKSVSYTFKCEKRREKSSHGRTTSKLVYKP